MVCACADPESFVRGVQLQLSFSYFFDERGKDSNTTISGPSTARQRNAIQMAFRWRANGDPLVSFVVLQGIRTNIAKKPYIFMIGSGPPVSPSGSARVYQFALIHLSAIAFEN